MQKHTILFLAANPSDTDPLALDREARAILRELEQSGHRDRFQLETRWAAEPLDLLRELRKLRPTVVHYSGHGGAQGLFFQHAMGGAQLVPTAALAETFGAAGASVQVVVLNACYSEAHADALLAHVDCVVGTDGPIRDEAVRSFAVGFYGGLGERESVAAAYRQGCAAISLAAPPEPGDRDVMAPVAARRTGERPRLKVRVGVDAEQLVLAADPR
ncbi:MAG TPA: CHAT domain-containing protein [Kofleriaceae bacterium]|nr:CHAT domain-containing protein [Kofleriaceae bacterium]